MSQQSLLQDIATWGPEECRKQLHQVLPKLIQYLNNAGSLEKETEIIQLICQSFVPVVSHKQAEAILFSKVVKKTAECVDVGLGEAERTAVRAAKEAAEQAGRCLQAASETISELMQRCVSLIGCLTSCVSHMTQVEGHLELTLVHSLPASVLHVIERSYSHCKASSDMYGELLGSLSHQLSVLFRQANSLQMAFIALLDKVHLGVDCSEQEVQDMVISIHGLFEVSQVAASLEVKVMLTLWKAVSRLSCQHKQALCNRLELDQMVTCLSADMRATYTYMFTLPNNQEADNKNYTKTTKVLGFQMRVLQMLIKEFDGHIGTGVKSVYNLILTLQSKVPPSLSAETCPPALLQEVDRQLIPGVAPLIRALLTSIEFAQCVTQTDQNHTHDLRLPWLLTILAILDQLPTLSEEVQTLWLAPTVHTEDVPRTGILTALFTAMSLCHVELSASVLLPGIMANGKPQMQVSLYEFVVTKVSGFVACCSAQHFNVMEKTLLANVLGKQFFPAVLAIDVWCFLARYGTADVCRDHCLLAAHLLTQAGLSPAPQCCHLIVLLRRLLRFMAPEHQEEFVHTFPASSHPALWSVVPLAILTPPNLTSLLDQLVTMATGHVDSWLTSPQRSTADAKVLTSSLHILHNVCASAGIPVKYLSEGQRAKVVSLCVRLWDDATTPRHVTDYPPLQATTAALYRLSVSLINYLDDKDIVKILSASSGLLSCDPPVSLKILILHFLGSIGKKRFSQPEEAHVVAELPALYRRLLMDPAVVVHQVALETFAQFAEETPHETVVPVSLQATPRLKEAVVAYVNHETFPDEQLLPPGDQLRHQAGQVEQMAAAPSSSLYPAPVWPAPEPHKPGVSQASKRQRCDTTDIDLSTFNEGDPDNVCASSLADLRRGVSTLTSLRRKGTLPGWVQEELGVIQLQLSELL